MMIMMMMYYDDDECRDVLALENDIGHCKIF